MTTKRELTVRYGETSRSTPNRILSFLLIVGFVVVVTWAAVGLSGTDVEGNVIGWEAFDREVVVDLEVRGTAPEGVACVLRATDPYAVDVGYQEVVVPDPPATALVTIPTVVRAGSVIALGCAPVGDDLSVPPPDFPPGVAIPQP
ncbi:MAG: hypothetical protein CMH41_04910 [Micrococcales bacterium]|nr:hypothetical protein [Micrococcales bacterium]